MPEFVTDPLPLTGLRSGQLAHTGGRDPLEFQLDLLSNTKDLFACFECLAAPPEYHAMVSNEGQRLYRDW
jgi:hypothetical protein